GGGYHPQRHVRGGGAESSPDRRRAGGEDVFFFQAEDGIRDRNVTGVQTCALPICPSYSARAAWGGRRRQVPAKSCRLPHRVRRRSEERRVGKECRSRCSPDHYKENGEEIVGRAVDGDGRLAGHTEPGDVAPALPTH